METWPLLCYADCDAHDTGPDKTTAVQYLIGTDEAGYGPNLGPLVVSATVWRVSDDLHSDDLYSEDLYQRLAGTIVRTPKQAAEDPATLVAMADSKVLYQPGKGLRNLERGLWAAWAAIGIDPPCSWSELCRAMTPGAVDDLKAIPWHDGFDPAVPIDVEPHELPAVAMLRERFDAAGVRLIDLSGRAVFPGRFNGLLARYGSKGLVLSNLTFELVADAVRQLPGGPISIVCDKHGGRNRYAGLLQGHFPDALIEIHEEGRRRSRYRFGPPERRVEITFQVKAESHLPVALASMASKYFRELAMRALNGYWCERVPGLRPTAGYPQDAKRFRAAIAAVQDELGVDDTILWRDK